MCSTFDVEITSKVRKLFELLKNYENYFDSKKAKTFSENKIKNHIINLISGAKPLYKPFYTFLEIELDILKDYLLKNLTLNCIREFTNRASASIFFVLKKNNF